MIVVVIVITGVLLSVAVLILWGERRGERKMRCVKVTDALPHVLQWTKEL